MLGAKKGAAQIRPDDPVPERLVHIPDRRPARAAPGEVRHDRRIVDQDIEATKPVHHLIDHRLHIPLAGHVGPDPQRLDLHSAELVRHLLGRRNVRYGDLRTLFRERVSDVSADSLCPAGNEDDLPL